MKPYIEIFPTTSLLLTSVVNNSILCYYSGEKNTEKTNLEPMFKFKAPVKWEKCKCSVLLDTFVT